MLLLHIRHILFPQEPNVAGDSTVMKVVQEGVKEKADLLARYDAINEGFADPGSCESFMFLIKEKEAQENHNDND